MSLAIIHSRAQVGVQAPAVSVEVHLANGLPALTLVGLPEAAVKESKDRVRSAIINSGFNFPARRITLNLAPADLPKDGGRFDLAIALGILAASVQVPCLALDDVECLGELALSGAVRAVNPSVRERFPRFRADPRSRPERRGRERRLAVQACVRLSAAPCTCWR